MRARHRLLPKLPSRLPDIWLFTDERQGDGLWAALERLPRGAGVVFRHYATPDRAALARRVRAVCRRRHLVFVVAGPPSLARAWRADGAHGRFPGALTAPAHGMAELVAAQRRGARLAFLSPLFATRSHPEARPLGRLRFGAHAQGAPLPVAALGGVTAAQARQLQALGASGWGAIDAWGRRPRPGLGNGTKPTRSDSAATMGGRPVVGGAGDAPEEQNRTARRCPTTCTLAAAGK